MAHDGSRKRRMLVRQPIGMMPNFSPLRSSFDTAPAWYRPVLRAEATVLERLKNHLPHTADLHGDDAELFDYASTAIGVPTAERMVPGANASPYMIEHVGRYLWAMNIARGQDVVDLGCGDGYGTFLLSWTATSAHGFDINDVAVARARGRYPDARYSAADICRAEALPRASLAVCFEVLEHLHSPEALLEAAAQRYPRLLISFPNPLVGGSHINPHHVNDWPLSRLKRRLREAGAKRLTGYHQRGYPRTRGDYVVRRGASPWNATWLFDVRF
jgi:SAM-dependent methyltransferase